MPTSAAERMAKTRARRRGELEAVRKCTVCGKILKPTSIGRAYDMNLCFQHWAETEEGKNYLKQRRSQRRLAKIGPQPFRYFGCPYGEDGWPEGPFNRMRLAVSSTYAGKGKPRGTLFIVWSDDTVTAHRGIRQSDVGTIERRADDEVDRSDLAYLARSSEALTERVRHYGHTDVYLV